jgi:hypothetical protein
VNRGRSHFADHGSGNRPHHVSANTARPEDRNQAGKNYTDRHQFRAESLHSTLNGGLGFRFYQWLGLVTKLQQPDVRLGSVPTARFPNFLILCAATDTGKGRMPNF